MNEMCTNLFYDEERETKQRLSVIAQANAYFQEQKREVEKAKKIEELLFMDLVRSVKANSTIWEFIDLEKAFHQKNEKYKKDRGIFEYAKNRVLEEFFEGLDLKFKEMVQQGYEGYGFAFHFESKDGKKVFIEIPKLAAINTKNFYYAHEGKFSFGIKESESYYHVLAQSYDMQEIKTAVKKYFESTESIE